MKRTEILKMIDADLIDRVYRYCYTRTTNSHEAEDLCSDILYAVVKSCHNDKEVSNPIGFFWSVAHNVYADYCEKKHIRVENTVEIQAELFEMIAAVLDLKNKEVIGYEIGKNIDSDLSMSALGNAIATRGRHKGLIFHSDRGTQYSSKKYKAMLKKTVLSVQ